MKKINKQNVFDLGLLFLSLLGWVNVIYFFIDDNTPELSIFYWAFFSILLIDRLIFKKINNILFWKGIFVFGVVVFIKRNLVYVKKQIDCTYKNTYKTKKIQK